MKFRLDVVMHISILQVNLYSRMINSNRDLVENPLSYIISLSDPSLSFFFYETNPSLSTTIRLISLWCWTKPSMYNVLFLSNWLSFPRLTRALHYPWPASHFQVSNIWLNLIFDPEISYQVQKSMWVLLQSSPLTALPIAVFAIQNMVIKLANGC